MFSSLKKKNIIVKILPGLVEILQCSTQGHSLEFPKFKQEKPKKKKKNPRLEILIAQFGGNLPIYLAKVQQVTLNQNVFVEHSK